MMNEGAGGGGGSYVNLTNSGTASTNVSTATSGALATNINNNGNGLVTISYDGPCYCEGTLIQTSRGLVAVERLSVGDLAVTASGAKRAIVWIGYRHVDLTRHADPRLAYPIRIAAGAFPGGLPHRDLLVSRDHAIAHEGMLIPAKLLANGASIVVETSWRSVTYFHVELDSHDLLLAEGLPAESTSTPATARRLRMPACR